MTPRLLAWSALILAAVLLRAWGLDFGSPPILNHPDESHYAGYAGKLSWGDLNPRYFENPPLLTYLLFAGRELHALGASDEAQEQWLKDGGLFRLGRWVVVLFGTLTVLLVGGAAGRLLGSRGAAFAAGAIVAFAFLHGRDSHYGVNDVPMVALLSLSLYAASRASTGGTLRWVWCSAVAAGLAASMKYTGAIAIALPLTVVALRREAATTRLRAALLVAALAAAACLATNPWPLLDFGEFAGDFRFQWSGWGDRLMLGQERAPLWALYGEASLVNLGLLHAVAAAAGLVLLLRRQPRVALLLLSAPALYLAVMLNKSLFFWRFALPLLPFLAVAAAAAWDALARRLAAALGRAAAAPAATTLGAVALLVLPASLQPAIQLARHDWLATRPGTWLQAREWIIEHVPPGDNLFVEWAPPHFPPGRYRLWRSDIQLDKLHLLTRTGPGGRIITPIAQGGWIVTDAWFEHSLQRDEGDASFYERLRLNFPPVAEFAPGPSGDPPFVVDAMYTPLTGLWGIERPGFTVRVHRVGPNEWKRMLGP